MEKGNRMGSSQEGEVEVYKQSRISLTLTLPAITNYFKRWPIKKAYSIQIILMPRKVSNQTNTFSAGQALNSSSQLSFTAVAGL